MKWFRRRRRRRRTVVYVLRGLGRRVLYVGITSRPAPQRWAEHARDKPWWNEVVFKQVVGSYGSVAAAERQEIALIRRHRPKYNIDHNDLSNVPSWYLRHQRRRRRRRRNSLAELVDLVALLGPIALAALVVADHGATNLSILASGLAGVVLIWPRSRKR